MRRGQRESYGAIRGDNVMAGLGGGSSEPHTSSYDKRSSGHVINRRKPALSPSKKQNVDINDVVHSSENPVDEKLLSS